MINQALVWRYDIPTQRRVSKIGDETFEGYPNSIGTILLEGGVSDIGSIKISNIGNSDLLVWAWDFNIVGTVK